MNITNLATAYSTAGAATAVQMNKTPALAYREAVLCIDVSPDYNRTIKVEGSEDGTTWADVAGATIAGANKPALKMNVSLLPHMRVNQTDDGSAGTANVNILA